VNPPSEADDTTMKDATNDKPEEKKPEKVKKEVSTACTIKLLFRNYGMEKAVLDVTIIIFIFRNLRKKKISLKKRTFY